MKATIRITMDNAAFEEPGPELARILTDLADKVQHGVGLNGGVEAGGEILLFDVNGNRVGSLKVFR